MSGSDWKSETDLGGKILVVDDDRSTRAALSLHLKAAGYSTLQAIDGEDALRIVGEEDGIDLVLLDIEMPRLNGFEVLARIRETFPENELPVMVITASSHKHQLLRAFETGANDYLTKPIDIEVALARIEVQMKLRRSQASLLAKQERYTLSEQGANDGLWDWELENDVVYYSSRWKAMLGLDEDAPVDSIDVWFNRIHREDEHRVQDELQAHLRGDEPHFETQLRIRHEDGNYRWMLCRGMAIRDPRGKATRIAGSLTDITEGKVADALTGLPNRIFFRDRLERAIEDCRSDDSPGFAVLFLDLDDFKLVNDSLGHQAGDQLLVEIARRLESCVRSREAFVARIGGDEFTLLLNHVPSREVAESVAGRLMESFKAPFVIGDSRELFITASVGITHSSNGVEDIDDLLRSADTAMYAAKANGRSQSLFYDPQMQMRKVVRMDLEGELRRADERGEIFLNYQPIVDLETGRLVSFEVLARWQHPRLGMISPDQFVTIAEETGMIVSLGESILKKACEQMVDWQQRFAACESIRLGVNVSGKQFAEADLVDSVQEILDGVGLAPETLTIEVTESTTMSNHVEVSERLSTLRNRGVRVAIDDFGTGYSSLAVLHHLPLDILKIDRSFVSRILDSPQNRAIIRTILSLADSLNLDVVAEGVETAEQRLELLSLGCVRGQGFYFSEPLDVEEVEQLFAQKQNAEDGIVLASLSAS